MGDRVASLLRRFSVLVESAATVVLATIVFVIGFGGDLRRLAGPLGGGDILPAYAVVKLWGEGAPSGNGTLGYPFGIALNYFPTTDFVQNAIAGLVAAVTHNPYTGLNGVFALSFPVTALAALWVFRLLGVRGPIAIFASLAFTAIPFHWLRLEHVYLGTMYSAVLGVGLALMVGTGAIERRLAGPRRWPTIVLLAGLSALIAASGIYYACFTILLCSAAFVYRLAHGPTWRGALASMIPLLSVPVLTAAALMPAFLFVREHPAIRAVANRLAIESVIYSGSLAFALIPAPMTELPILKDLNPRIENAFAVANASGTSGVFWYSNFGSLFTVLALAFTGVGLFWSVRRRARATANSAAATVAQTSEVGFGLVGLLLATAVLFYVPWGLNVVFAAVFSPQLRAWDRLTPVLMLLFFAGAMVAWRSMALPQRGVKVLLIAVGCSVLLLFDSVIPYQAGFAAASVAGNQTLGPAKAYAAAVNAAIPGKCGMLQLPYQGYPEEPPLLKLGSFDPLWPALANPEKDWTFGAIKGTVGSEWQSSLGSDIDASAVSNLVAGGFCGIHVDRRGLTPDEQVAVSARLVALLGEPVATGHSGDWAAYALPAAGPGTVLDVRHVAGLPGNVAAFYYPPVIGPRLGDNTLGAERDGFGPWWRATADSTDLTVTSLEPSVPFEAVTGTLQAGDCVARDVTIELRSDSGTVTTSFHLEAGEQHDFILKLGQKTTNAVLVVNAPGALCTSADKVVSTVAIHGPRAQ
jgi:phosphoglycerol transferase